MPATIDANLRIRGSDVKLSLRRNVLARWNIPVFTLTEGHFVPHDTASRMDGGRSGFYQDRRSEASLYVRRPLTNLEAFDLVCSGEKADRALRVQTRRARRLSLTGQSIPHSGHHTTGQLQKIPQNDRYASRPDHEVTFENRETLQQSVVRGRRHSRVAGYGSFHGDLFGAKAGNSTELTGASRRYPRSREPRQSSVMTHTVELTIVADYKIFERFLRYAKGDRERALSEMKLYYIFLTNLMDIRYAGVTTLDPSLNIRVALVSLVVSDVRQEAVWTERNRLGEDSVNAERALYTFRDWLRGNRHIPRADHWMLLSGYDLAESSGTAATIGIAFIGTLCTDSAVSVVEEYFTATTGAVSAHELGHSSCVEFRLETPDSRDWCLLEPLSQKSDSVPCHSVPTFSSSGRPTSVLSFLHEWDETLRLVEPCLVEEIDLWTTGEKHRLLLCL
ncbi:hypothetical protein ACOMHN_031800 [Nucella lapillus]